MCETSSFFYYIIIRFCHPYGVLWWVGHPPGVYTPVYSLSSLRDSLFLITPFGRADARTERPYNN